MLKFFLHLLSTLFAVLQKIFKGFLLLLTPKGIRMAGVGVWKFIHSFFIDGFVSVFAFNLILVVYLGTYIILAFFSVPLIPKSVREKIKDFLMWLQIRASNILSHPANTINRLNIIDLAFRNMFAKKSRSLVTIGGMAIGIAIIVFLVSIGYGLQNMVIGRVSRLEELSQANILPQPGSGQIINDQTMQQIREIPNVGQILPIIAGVARITYNNSISDMPVYGVTSDYLKQSAIEPKYGEIFESNELSSVRQSGVVAGATAKLKEARFFTDIGPIAFSLPASQWIPVFDAPSSDAQIIGYTKRAVQEQAGRVVWGKSYKDEKGNRVEEGIDPAGVSLARWISSKFALWKNAPCNQQDLDCQDGEYTRMVLQDLPQGYLPARDISFSMLPTEVAATSIPTLENLLGPNNTTSSGGVLGLTTLEDNAPPLPSIGQVLAETDISLISGSVTAPASSLLAGVISDGDWVEIASEGGQTSEKTVTRVNLSDRAKKLAVVNAAMTTLLGIPDAEAVGETFTASFVIPGELLENPDDKLESTEAEYVIMGVIPDDRSPFFYVPFLDLRTLGVTRYSQAKVSVLNQEVLPTVRRQIEGLGFSTSSAADTVRQIELIFATLRNILSLIGLVALGIAALGMFNTLTVSLLERTREVGLMKALGMRSQEVRELFLTESMIMGFFGGTLGIMLGIGAGELLGLALSVVSLREGQGFIDISFLPISFTLFIFFLSLFVGLFTGIYPSRRATKISALNALRYE